MTCTREGCGFSFSLELSKQEFVDNDHLCPECEGPTKRSMFSTGGIPAGGKAMGMLASYPYYNTQIPLRPGQKPGEPNVLSRSHENEICRGLIGDQKWERNAI